MIKKKRYRFVTLLIIVLSSGSLSFSQIADDQFFLSFRFSQSHLKHYTPYSGYGIGLQYHITRHIAFNSNWEFSDNYAHIPFNVIALCTIITTPDIWKGLLCCSDAISECDTDDGCISYIMIVFSEGVSFQLPLLDNNFALVATLNPLAWEYLYEDSPFRRSKLPSGNSLFNSGEFGLGIKMLLFENVMVYPYFHYKTYYKHGFNGFSMGVQIGLLFE